MANRLAELLADQATAPLTPTELSELDTLLHMHPQLQDSSGRPIDAESIAALTGSLIAGWSSAKTAAMPGDVRARLLNRGLDVARENAREASRHRTISISQPPPTANQVSDRVVRTGGSRPFSWPLLLTAAAACAALCTSVFMLVSSQRSQAEAVMARQQLETQQQESTDRLAAADGRISTFSATLEAQRQDANARLALAAEQFAALDQSNTELSAILQGERSTAAKAVAQATADLASADSEIESLQTRLAVSERKLTAAEDRISLLQQNPDNVQIAWTATDIPEAKGVTGDVVWNARLQQGYLRFKGLSANDPGKEQYQAWIFDEGRDPKFPVDAGVFDITLASKDEATGDLIIPIDPKLLIKNPAAFAVTLETPGGVVVTDKKRVVVLAPVAPPTR